MISSDWNEDGDSRGIARALDPGLSFAREAAKAVPPESVRRNGNQQFLLSKVLLYIQNWLKESMKLEYMLR